MTQEFVWNNLPFVAGITTAVEEKKYIFQCLLPVLICLREKKMKDIIERITDRNVFVDIARDEQ